jgi:hypothetical protein
MTSGIIVNLILEIIELLGTSFPAIFLKKKENVFLCGIRHMKENNKSKKLWIFCVRQGGISPEVG